MITRSPFSNHHRLDCRMVSAQWLSEVLSTKRCMYVPRPKNTDRNYRSIGGFSRSYIASKGCVGVGLAYGADKHRVPWETLWRASASPSLVLPSGQSHTNFDTPQGLSTYMTSLTPTTVSRYRFHGKPRQLQVH
jgi:hypothetical protein